MKQILTSKNNLAKLTSLELFKLYEYHRDWHITDIHANTIFKAYEASRLIIAPQHDDDMRYISSSYESHVNKFCKQHNVRIKVLAQMQKLDYDHFKIKITRNKKSMIVNFTKANRLKRASDGYGGYLLNRLTAYEILACLTKHDYGSFDDFCSEFGYDNDSIKAFKTYKAVCREYNQVSRVFGDILEQLAEIE